MSERPQPAIVITGAATPLGREFARLAALDGSALVLVDETDARAAEYARYGVGTTVIEIDVADAQAPERLQRALAQRGLYCDVLINSAAIGVVGETGTIPRRKQIDMIDLNVRALTALTLCFVPAMVARGEGSVLNVGSLAPAAPSPQLAVYDACKAYVNAFSAALARELAGTGVTVTCVAAGLITESLRALASEREFNLLPQSTAADTALTAWLGLKIGQRRVVPPLANALAATLGRWLPHALARRFLAIAQAQV